jgi:hypothetical protein
MKKLLFFTVFLTSCFYTDNIFLDKKIDRYLVSNSNKMLMRTNVERYSPSKKWFYGSIEIVNKTEDTLSFNFNQGLKTGKDTIFADYNFVPVSYAFSAFYIYPQKSKVWEVVWKTKSDEIDINNIELLSDTTTLNILKF